MFVIHLFVPLVLDHFAILSACRTVIVLAVRALFFMCGVPLDERQRDDEHVAPHAGAPPTDAHTLPPSTPAWLLVSVKVVIAFVASSVLVGLLVAVGVMAPLALGRAIASSCPIALQRISDLYTYSIGLCVHTLLFADHLTPRLVCLSLVCRFCIIAVIAAATVRALTAVRPVLLLPC